VVISTALLSPRSKAIAVVEVLITGVRKPETC
jgi:hypothetical protein